MTELSTLLNTYTPTVPAATADGTDARIIAQDGGGSSGDGGDVLVQSGTAVSGNGGDITLVPGVAGGSGIDGHVICELPAYADYYQAHADGMAADGLYRIGNEVQIFVPPVFGVAADRINLLRPVRLEMQLSLQQFETLSTANYVYEWEPSYPGEFVNNGGTGDPYVTVGVAVEAPDGSLTANKIVESVEDIPPEYAEKPAAWDLTGYSSKWSDFWTAAVAVVPCWEGTGAPNYYVAGGAVGLSLVQVGSPTWSMHAGHGAALSFPAGANDWRIAQVGGLDIMPTAGMTMLWVRKMAVPQGSQNYSIGLVGGASTLYVLSRSGALAHQFESAFQTTAGFSNHTTSTTDIEMHAVVWGTTGTHFYYRNGLSLVQGIAAGANATAKGPRTRQNLPFGLATGRNVTTTLGMDLLFFAALDAEWTQTQILEWMNDPYAPVREDGGGDRALHAGVPVVHSLHAGIVNLGSSKHIRYRCAVLAKAAERSRFQLELANARSGAKLPRAHGVRATFDLSDGTIAVAAAAFGTHVDGAHTFEWLSPTASITPYRGEWYLCELDATCPSTANTFYSNGTLCTLLLDKGEGEEAVTTTYAGDGISGIYAWRSCLLPARAFTELTARQFHDDFNDPSTIDADNTLQPGYNWYVENYAPGWNPSWNSTPSPPSYYSVADSELGIFHDGTTGANRTLNSASWNGSGWVGYRFQLPILLEYSARWVHLGEADASGDPANGVPAVWTQCSEALEMAGIFGDQTPDGVAWPGYMDSGETFPEIFAVPTTASAAIGTRVLTFSYVPTFLRVVGTFLWSQNGAIPADTRIASATTTTVTMDQDLISPGITAGDIVHVNWAVEHDFQETNAYLEAFDPHTPYAHNILLPGYSSMEISDIGPLGGAERDYTVLHTYSTLWLPKTATENGMFCSFADGLFVAGTLRTYGPGTQAQSLPGAWYYGDERNFHYPLFVGAGGRAPSNRFPGWWDYITIFGRQT